MGLSRLQKYILRELAQTRQKQVPSQQFRKYYTKQSAKPKQNDIVSIVSTSIERLIERGLVVGYGRRTKEKWFIETISLTPNGRHIARALLGQQQRLPLFRRKKHSSSSHA
ncbi:MAG: hypothetical protein H6760_01375 [Candidatus Nomurabacteria bacterium]|nr:MAG: hypothetical protein H6760_01375 [Candidatus Nomurabacteria bacterium]